MPKVNPLPPEDLSWRCGPERFSFATTSEVASLSEIVGQDRALRSIEFGLGITNHNYNIFVLGDTGVGKETTVRDIVERKAKGEPVPDDWCYVFNFEDADNYNYAYHNYNGAYNNHYNDSNDHNHLHRCNDSGNKMSS